MLQQTSSWHPATTRPRCTSTTWARSQPVDAHSTLPTRTPLLRCRTSPGECRPKTTPHFSPCHCDPSGLTRSRRSSSSRSARRCRRRRPSSVHRCWSSTAVTQYSILYIILYHSQKMLILVHTVSIQALDSTSRFFSKFLTFLVFHCTYCWQCQNNIKCYRPIVTTCYLTIWNEDRPILWRNKCNEMTTFRKRTVYAEIRGNSLEMGCQNNIGCRQRQFSAFSLAISSETLEIRPALSYSAIRSPSSAFHWSQNFVQ